MDESAKRVCSNGESTERALTPVKDSRELIGTNSREDRALIPVIDSDKSGITRSGNVPALIPVIDSLEAGREITFEKSGNFSALISVKHSAELTAENCLAAKPSPAQTRLNPLGAPGQEMSDSFAFRIYVDAPKLIARMPKNSGKIKGFRTP